MIVIVIIKWHLHETNIYFTAIKKRSMSTILEVNKVVKRYGDYVALNEVSMSIPRGSIYGL
jgi:ABC-type uncharacterized transport system ATPase subunit